MPTWTKNILLMTLEFIPDSHEPFLWEEHLKNRWLWVIGKNNSSYPLQATMIAAHQSQASALWYTEYNNSADTVSDTYRGLVNAVKIKGNAFMSYKSW